MARSQSAMPEILDLAHLPIPDRAQLEEMNGDRDAALSASTTLANESHDATVPHLDHFKQLPDEVDPPIAKLLAEGDDLREPPKMLRGVGVGLPVRPDHLDLRIKSCRKGFAGQLPAHERIAGVNALSDRVRVLRHRLPPLLGEPFGGCAGLVDVEVIRTPLDQPIYPRDDGCAADLNPTRTPAGPAALAPHT